MCIIISEINNFLIMPKPKFIKPLLIGVACTIPVGLVVGLSVNWDHTQYIAAVGSSGVKPFIENFGKQYHKVFKNFDVTVESGGTTFAVEQLAKGYTNLGNASNNPYPNIVNQGYLDKWTNMKTLTLGWEGLCLVYSLPKDLSQEAKNNFEIVINSNNILHLYAVFSCIHELKNEQWQDDYDSLWHFAPASVQAKITNVNDQNLLKSTKILPFLRAGGNTGANSSIAFSYYSNLADFGQMTEAQQKAFSGGQYGDDASYMETDESNARAWQSVVNKKQAGSMVYLTTSFLTSPDNIKQIKDGGYKIAQYQNDEYDPVAINLDNIQESLQKIATKGGYNWYRPINVMIDMNVQKSKDFLNWIYKAEAYEKTVLSLGANPLSERQFNSMLGTDGQLFSPSASDIELVKTRIVTTNVFGAEDLWD